MSFLNVAKHLINKNGELIEKTVIKDCHALGLNSFIINESPKIRLFVAEPGSELHQPFDCRNPLIPIHAHKYDDEFVVLSGCLNNHVYLLDEEGTETSIPFNKYTYRRIGDKETVISKVGAESLIFEGTDFIESTLSQRAEILHTATVTGKQVIWAIIELTEDTFFEQLSYHQNLVERPELYKRFPNAHNYLKKLVF